MDPDNRFERVRAAIEQLGPADHVCTLYDQRDEELAIAVSYIRAGLDRGELCVCVVDDGGESILDALVSEGVDIDAEMRKGRLTIFEKPLAQGLKTLDMLGKIEQFASESRKAGYAGFRIVGEMSWALDGDLKALAEFEARLNLNRVWERHACAGLCQFDVRRFKPETLREMIIVHPLVVIGDRICRNPYYVAPEQYLSPDWPLHEADWMMTNLEQLQQSEDSLRASQERYRSLSRRLLEQQEHERAALARELHDQLGQSLVAISLNLQAIEDELSPSSRARVPESTQIIKKMIDKVRTLAFELRPSILDEFGLIDALQNLVTRHGERAGVRASFTATPTDARAPVEIETACFRIAQEALTNVARHARARHVEVTLIALDAALDLTIRDDGVGFFFERRRSGLGLVGMGERAELAGGRLDIESAPGAGTTVRARFPLPSPK
ncbi:MAG TPA: MEDS domain-containing protein [Pyrinomonadaceae bacterium]|nr:MEDS domain-containing protein [Pyrinomonadaceae bacterium]